MRRDCPAVGAPFLPQISLMKTENVQLTFDDDAIKEIARISAEVRGPWVAMPRFDAAAGMVALGWALASATSVRR